MAAACGQPALQTPLPTALASARTFGAKHGRGLPPDRSLFEPHGGSLRANGPANGTRKRPSPARAPSVRNIAGGFRPTAQGPCRCHVPYAFRAAIWWESRFLTGAAREGCFAAVSRGNFIMVQGTFAVAARNHPRTGPGSNFKLARHAARDAQVLNRKIAGVAGVAGVAKSQQRGQRTESQRTERQSRRDRVA